MKQFFIMIFIGAILLAGWHFFMDVTLEPEGSLDIVSGALLEFFLFNLLIFFYQKQEMKQRQKELDAHLDKIEKLISEGGSKNGKNI